MKWFQRIFQIIVIAAVVLVIGIGAQEAQQANNSGSYSNVCGVITKETEAWVLAQFGDNETLEELLWDLEDFVCHNFVYTRDSLNILQQTLQHFDMQSFIESGFRGICFDFACFCKNVVLIWSQARGEQVQAFVCEVRQDLLNGHAYNYFRDANGNGWYVDVTSDNTAYKDGDAENFWGPQYLGSTSFDAYTQRLYSGGFWFSWLR